MLLLNVEASCFTAFAHNNIAIVIQGLDTEEITQTKEITSLKNLPLILIALLATFSLGDLSVRLFHVSIALIINFTFSNMSCVMLTPTFMLLNLIFVFTSIIV